jgi:hypothetical protein
MKGKSHKTPTAAQPPTKLDGILSVFSIPTTEHSAAAPTNEFDDRTKRGAARIRLGGVDKHTPGRAEELFVSEDDSLALRVAVGHVASMNAAWSTTSASRDLTAFERPSCNAVVAR